MKTNLLLSIITAGSARYSYTWGADGECRTAGRDLGIQTSQQHCAREAGGAGCESFMFALTLSSCRCCENWHPTRNDTALELLYNTYEVLDCAAVFAEQPTGKADSALSSAVLGAYGRLWSRAKGYLHC